MHQSLRKKTGEPNNMRQNECLNSIPIPGHRVANHAADLAIADALHIETPQIRALQLGQLLQGCPPQATPANQEEAACLRPTARDARANILDHMDELWPGVCVEHDNVIMAVEVDAVQLGLCLHPRQVLLHSGVRSRPVPEKKEVQTFVQHNVDLLRCPLLSSPTSPPPIPWIKEGIHVNSILEFNRGTGRCCCSLSCAPRPP